MKKLLAIGISLIILMSLALFLPALMDHTGWFRAEAEDAGWSEEESGESAPDQNGASDRFLVLEIVPYKGLGEIGYLVGGEEPIDEELMNKDSAAGDVSFLGGAITPYNSYTEKSLPASGNADKGWIPINEYYTQNGYFEYVGPNNTGVYQKVAGQTVYSRVADGQGSYQARLGTENSNIYNRTWNQTNERNVNAYFIYGKPAGITLYSQTDAYLPCSVTRNQKHTGDYDYDSETRTFLLNKGKGSYDVLFSRTSATSNVYYMTADYEITDDNTGDYSWSITYEYVGATGGNYTRIDNGIAFQYQANNEWTCRYRWVPSEEALNKPSNYYQEGTPGTIGDRVWVKGQRFVKTVEYNFNVTLVNNEWFKRLTLGIAAKDCEQFPVDVVTMTPAQLNLPENQHYLEEANMFYVNDKLHNQSYIDLYETKSFEGQALPDSEKYKNRKGTLNFGMNDLNWSSTMKIFNRVTGVKQDGSLGGYRAAIVFDDTFYQAAVSGNGDYAPYSANVNVSFTWNGSGATVCNLAKLYIMLYQRDPVKFYNTFLSPSSPRRIIQVSSRINSTGTTGSFVRPDSSTSPDSTEAAFWNGNTFCAYILNDSKGLTALNINIPEQKLIIEKEIPNFNITAQTTDMIANVLVLNGQDIFTSKYIQPLDNMPADSLAEAQIYEASMNGGAIPSYVAISGYINVITNSGLGYEFGSGVNSGTGEDGLNGSNLRTYTSVLNIQPTADFTASENNIRQMLEDYGLKIVNMTSAEFNSSMVDINTHFDMVYIGCGTGRFNTVGTGTVFNKAEDAAGIPEDNLNGSVYNKGDRVLTADGAKNYTGNDLTLQKITELKNFMAAGYPVVLENGLYSLSGVVHKSTNLYSFIQTAKGSAPPVNLLNYADYLSSKVSFMGKLTYGLKIARPKIRMLEPVQDNSSGLNYTYVDPASNTLGIKFTLVPNDLVEDSSRKYNAYLYMDYNGDGIFSETERLNAVPTDGSSAYGIEESKTRTYSYSYDMSKYNGVYKWQVKVVKQYSDDKGISRDTQIRSEITGYAACTNRQIIHILQITDNPERDVTAYFLENKVNDSASLISKYGGFQREKLKDYDLDIKTLSVKEFLKLYADKPYTAASAAQADELAGYHLLILDNQEDAITDEYGALANIKAEIVSGMGILFTRDAVSYTNQSDYLSPDNYLFDNQYTYPMLSLIATPTKDNNNGNYNDDDPYYIFNFNISGFQYKMNLEQTYHTIYLTKTNEGADTQYPYHIRNAVKISETSYEKEVTVDYDRENGVPLTGWYCLSDSRDPAVRGEGLAEDITSKEYTGIYSSSPNDVKNNYYLFNRGKIYYSGINLSAADRTGNDEEIKLFINTIIAVYKTSGRVIAKAPSIRMKQPLPTDNTITIKKSDIEGLAAIPVIFDIKDSTSDMNLTILWDSLSAVEGNWNKQLYQVSASGERSVVSDRTNITNGTYEIFIPVEALSGEHLLTIRAVNMEGKSASLDTTLRYVPISVTIDNEDLMISNGKQYLYADTDDTSADDETNLSNTGDIKIKFTVNAPDKFSVNIKDLSGTSIDVTGSKIYTIGDDAITFHLGERVVSNGSYYFYLPASVLKASGSIDIKVEAQVNDTDSGSSAVTLIRRSLFRLD